MNELIEVISGVLGERPAVEYQPVRPLDVPVGVLSIRRAREELGWGSHTDLAEGITRTWGWICLLSENRVES